MRPFILALALALACMPVLPVSAQDAAAPSDALGLPESAEILSAACLVSPGMKAMFDATEGDGTAARIDVCGCLVEVLGPQITLADARILARELDGSLTNEDREGYANGEQLGTIAEAGFVTCQQRTNHFTTD